MHLVKVGCRSGADIDSVLTRQFSDWGRSVKHNLATMPVNALPESGRRDRHRNLSRLRRKNDPLRESGMVIAQLEAPDGWIALLMGTASQLKATLW